MTPTTARALVLAAFACSTALAQAQPIRVGILHSLTGTMAISERSLVDAVEMAIDEVNAEGGLLGRKIVGVLEDGASDPDVFARKAERLIQNDRVSALFGCWTSSARKAVLPVVEKHDHVLFYPLQYEGQESSKNVIYSGATPHQQIEPALNWCMRRFGKRALLVGSDYVFPRTANALIRKLLDAAQGTCVGEEYRPLGSTDFSQLVSQIKSSDPDFVINTLNGDSNVAFFRALQRAGLGPAQIPVMSLSIAEDELCAMGPELAVEHFATWTYFQSLDSPANHRFVSAFKQRYGPERVTDAPIASAYTQVLVYAAAVRKAGSIEPAQVRAAARGLEIDAPAGHLKIDPDNLHTWGTAHVGLIQSTGQFRILWSSATPLAPDPFFEPGKVAPPTPGPPSR